MKKALLLSALFLASCLPVGANPVTTYPGGIDQAHTFGKNGSLTNQAVTVSFGTTSSGGAIVLNTVSVVNNSTGTDSIFLQTNGTAASGSTAEIEITPGKYYTYEGTAIHSVSIYSAGTGVKYSVGGN